MRPATRAGRRAGRKRSAVCVCVLAALAPSGGSGAAEIAEQRMTVTPITRFDLGSDETRFGRLEFVGGFRFASSDRRLRGVSSIRLNDDRTRFLAITDTGFWFSGELARDAAGRPTGFAAAAITPILGADGEARVRRKGESDAEGLAIDGTRAIVAFERNHRIAEFPRLNGTEGQVGLPIALKQPIPLYELRSNAGIETVAVSPQGRRIVVTEQSIDANGDLFAGILGLEGGIFKVRRQVPWHVTDGDFLPNGDLLLLERRFEGFGRVGMRIRQIDGGSIKVGALVDGPVLMEADLGQEIDNMEGLDVSVGRDGETYLSVVSDDNGSYFQRNLFLEFRLLDDVGASSLRPG